MEKSHITYMLQQYVTPFTPTKIATCRLYPSNTLFLGSPNPPPQTASQSNLSFSKIHCQYQQSDRQYEDRTRPMPAGRLHDI